MKYYAGIDIGGTKTAVGLFDEGFASVAAETIPTCPETGCSVLVERIGATFRSLLEQQGLTLDEIRSVGVASPGPLDLKTGRIVHIPTMGFRDEPLRDLLEAELGLPVSLENDTNAAALCESVFGRGKECDLVAYVTVSTGVGCGLAYQKHIIDGNCYAAGELGHLCTERGGRPCACGGHGCLEQYASGTAIAAIASERLGERVDARQVFERARAGGAIESAVIAEAADHLGFGIAAVYQLLDPDIVVLGGSVTKDHDVLQPLLEDAVARYAQAIPGRDYRIEVSDFDGAQVLLGAAYYGFQQTECR